MPLSMTATSAGKGSLRRRTNALPGSAWQRDVKIPDDSRHSDAQILYISPANDRIVEKWSMGEHRERSLAMSLHLQIARPPSEVIEPPMFTETMREFAKRLRDAQ